MKSINTLKYTFIFTSLFFIIVMYGMYFGGLYNYLSAFFYMLFWSDVGLFDFILNSESDSVKNILDINERRVDFDNHLSATRLSVFFTILFIWLPSFIFSIYMFQRKDIAIPFKFELIIFFVLLVTIAFPFFVLVLVPLLFN